MPRLKEIYKKDIIPSLKSKFGYKNIYMLQKMGYDIGIDINKISSLSKLLEKEIGTSYFSGEIYKTI